MEKKISSEFSGDNLSDSQEIPLWFRSDGKLKQWVTSKRYVPMIQSHYKVTIRMEEPEHSGYCSDYGSDSSESDSEPSLRYVSKILHKDFRVDTWDTKDFIDERSFTYQKGCRGSKSMFCRLKTRVTIIGIEKVLFEKV